MASSAARLRRSALAERARLQAEWAALKGPEYSCDVLRGVVALVSVAEASKAAGLRAALAALGASVLQAWSPLVTHVIWGPDGCRQIRAKARALAARLVSPLWVEACASSTRRLPEKAFPTATRPSDLPSPRTLRLLLKKADKENLPLEDIFNQTDTKTKSSQNKQNQLRITTDNDTSNTSSDESQDESRDNLPSKVNTAVRKGAKIEPVPAKKSRRKLFTYKEGEDIGSSSDEEKENAPKSHGKPMSSIKLTQRERKDLARAERVARRLANANTPSKPAATQATISLATPVIAITGMSKSERQIICDAIRKLNGKLQGKITRKTTHVILGSCTEKYPQIQNNKLNNEITGIEEFLKEYQTETSKATQSTVIQPNNVSRNVGQVRSKPRTINALEGAARGCKVLKSSWVLDSLAAGRWIYPYGYEVQHLKKLSERARIERRIFGFDKKEYAYDVFSKLRVCVTSECLKRDDISALLKLCGAALVTESGAPDVTVGKAPRQVSPKWVYDSVQAARPRTVRRYLNPEQNFEDVIQSMESDDFNAFMQLDLS